MNDKRTTHISKFLSLVLRHKPEEVGIDLDEAGWTEIDGLLAAMARHGQPITREELDHVVVTSEKKRFAISDDCRRIRANQGHSVEVDLGYASAEPPEFLYHGTVPERIDSIRTGGLVKGNRHDVHLSPDRETAIKVATRRGKPIILRIKSGEMHRAGYLFVCSDNNVWLTDHVPPEFIEEN